MSLCCEKQFKHWLDLEEFALSHCSVLAGNENERVKAGQTVVDCASINMLPDIKFKIGKKAFAMTPDQYIWKVGRIYRNNISTSIRTVFLFLLESEVACAFCSCKSWDRLSA